MVSAKRAVVGPSTVARNDLRRRKPHLLAALPVALFPPRRTRLTQLRPRGLGAWARRTPTTSGGADRDVDVTTGETSGRRCNLAASVRKATSGGGDTKPPRRRRGDGSDLGYY